MTRVPQNHPSAWAPGTAVAETAGGAVATTVSGFAVYATSQLVVEHS